MLDALAKEQQPAASEYLSTLMYVPSRSACEEKRDDFALRFKKTDAHRRCRIVGSIFFGKEHPSKLFCYASRGSDEAAVGTRASDEGQREDVQH